MAIARVTDATWPRWSRELTVTRAFTVRPRGSSLKAAVLSLTRTGLALPAATLNGASAITRQPRAQRAALAFLPRAAATISSMRTRPRQTPVATAGQPTSTGTVFAVAGSSTVAGATIVGAAVAVVPA